MNVLDFSVSMDSASSIVQNVMKSESTRPISIACFNPHSYYEAKRNFEFSNALKKCDVLVPDGAGIEFAAMFLQYRKIDRVTGSDVFNEFMLWGVANDGLRVFLLGSSEETLNLMSQNIKRFYPGVTVCGVFSPSFSNEFNDSENNLMIEAVQSATADVLFVGMTAPKQELWMTKNIERLQCRSVVCVGAVFDFVAGTRTRPGVILRKLRLEWLGRLLKEPTRMWRRTLISAPVFVKDLFLYRIFNDERK